MDIWFALENKLFNELVNFEFEEIRKAFNCFQLFVSPKEQNDFIKEASEAKQRFEEKVKKIDEYATTKYESLVKAGVSIGFEEEPGYRYQIVEAETKNDLIELFKKYFDVDIFSNNKDYLKDKTEEIKENDEDISNLRRATTAIRHHFYAFLSIIGWYQRHKHYFLSRSDVGRICRAYTFEVNCINSKLGLEHSPYRNVFGSWGRVDPKLYLDVDKISLRDLVLKFCKTNTAQLARIAEICGEVFETKEKKKFDEDGNEIEEETKFQKIIKKSNEYITKCENQGIMKVLN